MKIWCIVLLLVLSAAAAVRADVRYYPIDYVNATNIFIVDPSEALSVANANPNAPFYLYFGDGLDVVKAKQVLNDAKTSVNYLNCTESLLGNNQPYTTGPKTELNDTILGNVFPICVSSSVEVSAATLGYKVEPAGSVRGFRDYYYYTPVLQFLDTNGQVISNLDFKVGMDTLVRAQLVVPQPSYWMADSIYKAGSGPVSDIVRVNSSDSSLKVIAGVDHFGEASVWSGNRYFKMSGTNVEFYDSTGSIKIETVQFVKGKTLAFRIRPTAAIQSGSVTLQGYELNGNYRVSGSLTLNITNPDVPSLNKAAIYDSDGDGIGDSIAGWFSPGLDKVGHGDSLTYFSSWPNNGELAQLSGSVDTTKPSVLSIKGFTLPAQTLPNDTGDFAVGMIARANGKDYTTRTVLLDSIGPVIQKVTLLAGRDGAPDTLVALFNKELDASSVKPRELLALDASPLSVLGGSTAGGRTWLFTVAPGSVQGGDKLGVNSMLTAGLKTADGVPAGKNLPATVMEAGRIPAVASQGNGFYDRDADGRMDSVSVTFAEKITASQLASIGFHILWKDSSGTTVDLQPKSSMLTVAADGKTVSWALDADSLGIMPYLTSIDSLSYGVTALVNTYEINGKVFGDTLMVAMGDSMPPVLVSAFLDPESSSKNKADKLNLVFSEAVNTTELTSMDYLEFEVDGVNTQFQLGNARWAPDGRSVELDLGKGTTLADRPNPADSLKLKMVGSGVQDLSGNASKSNAQNVLLEGDPRVLVEVNDLVGLDREDMGLDSTGRELPPVSEKFYPNATTMDDLGGAALGVLLDVGQATIPADSLGTLDLSKISFTWELKIYTSQGAYVAGSRAEVRCDDSRFDGDCFANRKKLFVRWNALSDEGRKAGVGVYVAKLRVKVKGQQDSRTIEEIYKWGVRAGASGRAVR